MNKKLPTDRVYRSNGFTLIELLTVIAVIGILAAILIPAVTKVQSSAVSSKSMSNLRQLGVAAQTYALENDGRLPHPNFKSEKLFWHEALWNTYYEDPYVEGIFETRESIFQSPYFGEDGVRLAYGMNGYLHSDQRPKGEPKVHDDLPVMRIEFPSKAVMFGDSEWQTLWIKRVVYPNNGKTNMIFVDCHVESLTPEEVTLRNEGDGHFISLK